MSRWRICRAFGVVELSSASRCVCFSLAQTSSINRCLCAGLYFCVGRSQRCSNNSLKPLVLYGACEQISSHLSTWSMNLNESSSFSEWSVRIIIILKTPNKLFRDWMYLIHWQNNVKSFHSEIWPKVIRFYIKKLITHLMGLKYSKDIPRMMKKIATLFH